MLRAPCAPLVVRMQSASDRKGGVVDRRRGLLVSRLPHGRESMGYSLMSLPCASASPTRLPKVSARPWLMPGQVTG